MAFEPGRQIGPYDIVSVLGSGGMGTVYLALDRRLKRQVALKFLHGDDNTATAEGWHRTLLREAQIASALNHPNICHVYDVGGEGHESWIAMEYVDGKPLAALIPEGGFPTTTATQIASQIAEALAHAHAQGVLHRDLKTANIVRDTAGRVKILDFGIAGRLPAAVAREVTHTEIHAETPVIQGTLPYLAPEILRNAPATEQSDLWSFGVLMYEMLTGSLPFKGGSTFELASAILDGPVPPLPARIPGPLARLVQRLLSKDPSERYGSAKEVAAALDAIAPAPQMRRPRVTLRAVLLAASILAIAIVSYSLWRSRQPARVEVSGQRLLSTMEGSHRAPAYSPDGRRLAFLALDTEGVTQIWVRNLSEDAAVQVTTGPVAAGRPRWSAATDRIVFARGNQGIWSVSPLGGAPTRIVERGFNPNLSRDGQRMVFESDNRLWTAAADGSDVRVVDDVPQVYYSVAMGPSLSPDGTLIAYFRPAAGPNGDLWIAPTGGGAPRQLTFDLREGGWPVWAPDGRTIVFSSARAGSRTLWQIPARGGDPVPVTTGAGEDDQPDISGDGRQLAYTNVRNTWELRVRDLATGTERSLLRRGLEILFPMFSPDGQRILFFGRSDRAVAIFTIGADGSDLRQLTGGRELNHQPRWDSQGQFVYFFQIEPELSFRRVPSLGGPSVRFRDWKWETHFAPRFDPSGRMIAYARLKEPGQTSGEPDRTVIHDVATGEERFWPAPVTYVTSWSTDGRQVVGARRDGTVVMCEVADATCRVLARGAQPVWPAGGDRVFFLRQSVPGGADQLWSIRTDGSGEALITELGHFRLIDRFFDASRTGLVVWAPFRAGQSELWAAELR